jgi:microcystin-dependent protein
MAVKIRRTYKGAAIAAALDSSGVSSATQTAISLSTSPASWPTGKFFVVVAPGTAQEEKMCVTLSGSTLTTVDPNNTSTSASANGRGVDDTTARSIIAGGAEVYPVFTAIDANEANELTSTYANQGGIVYQGASTFTQLGIGTAGHVLKVNSGVTAPEWGQLTSAGLATDSVGSAQIAANAVDTLEINNGAVTLAKLATAVQNFLIPVGTINAYAGVTAPTGWLLCNGTSTSGYTALAALVGATTPDLQGHTLVGKGSAPFDGALLSKFGSTTSTAAHTHAIDHDHPPRDTAGQSTGHTHGQLVGLISYAAGDLQAVVTTPVGSSAAVDTGYSTGGNSIDHSHNLDMPSFAGTSGASSVGATHGNVQPSALVNFIIKHD